MSVQAKKKRERVHIHRGNKCSRFQPEANVSYCLISYREGLGTSLQLMGLATIDTHIQKEHT